MGCLLVLSDRTTSPESQSPAFIEWLGLSAAALVGGRELVSLPKKSRACTPQAHSWQQIFRGDDVMCDVCSAFHVASSKSNIIRYINNLEKYCSMRLRSNTFNPCSIVFDRYRFHIYIFESSSKETDSI